MVGGNVGEIVGNFVGVVVRNGDGMAVTVIDGVGGGEDSVGCSEGGKDSRLLLGSPLGTTGRVGASDGTLEGLDVSKTAGAVDGVRVGNAEGTADEKEGESVGNDVGGRLGNALGDCDGAIDGY